MSRLSLRSRRAVILFAALGTSACVLLSALFNYLLLFSETLGPFERSAVTAIAVPIVIGLPLFLALGLKMRETTQYRREINRLASYDRTTECLNGTAFSAIIDRRARKGGTEGPRRGAFLIVEADELRAINAKYGPNWGDEALRLIASTIRSSVRKEDIVGRIGTSDFGIFLPGATEEDAEEIGERILGRVSEAYFVPEGEETTLHIGLRGVIFEAELGFEEMFKAASRVSAEADRAESFSLHRFTQLPGARYPSS